MKLWLALAGKAAERSHGNWESINVSFLCPNWPNSSSFSRTVVACWPSCQHQTQKQTFNHWGGFSMACRPCISRLWNGFYLVSCNNWTITIFSQISYSLNMLVIHYPLASLSPLNSQIKCSTVWGWGPHCEISHWLCKCFFLTPLTSCEKLEFIIPSWWKSK